MKMFKLGDKIRCISTVTHTLKLTYTYLTLNKIYIVLDNYDPVLMANYVFIKHDDPNSLPSGHTPKGVGAYHESIFELVEIDYLQITKDVCGDILNV